MRQFFATLCVALAHVFPAHADHNSIVFGEERFESVVFCVSEKAAMALAQEEERSIAAGESADQYLENIQNLFTTGQCGAGLMRYTPEETTYQWTGRVLSITTGKITFSKISFIRSQAKFQVGERTLYIVTADEAPPVTKTPGI